MKLPAKSTIFRITIDRIGNVEKRILYGPLSGHMAHELAVNWSRPCSKGKGRECVIDLREVTTVDERGEQVLMEMMREGVRFNVRGVYLTTLLEGISERCNRENK